MEVDRCVYDEAYAALLAHDSEDVRRSLAALRDSVSRCVCDVGGKRQLNRKREEIEAAGVKFVRNLGEKILSRGGAYLGRHVKPKMRKVVDCMQAGFGF